MSASPLSAAYDGFVCDLDGVVYRGDAPVPAAPEALQRLVARGQRLVYATNNASREPAEVADQLTRVGAPAAPEMVVTSAEAGAAEVARRVPGGKVLAMGGPGVATALREAGLVAIDPSSAAAGLGVEAVLQGLGRQLRVSDFELAARHLTQGAEWVVTNEDTTFPLEWGLAPGNGAYARLLADATGRTPVVVGKPHAPLYLLALERLGTTPTRTLAIGDRLDTDIDGAGAAGLDSAWVLTGVDAPSALLSHPGGTVPTYVIDSLEALEAPYAAVLASEGGFTCAGGRVSWGSAGLVVEPGSAQPIELVRAALAASLDAVRGPRRVDPGPLGRQVDSILG